MTTRLLSKRTNRKMKKEPNFEEIRPLLEVLVAHEDNLPDEWL